MVYHILQHSGHTFKPLDDVYNEHMKKITEELNQLKRRHVELISLVQDVVGLGLTLCVLMYDRRKALVFFIRMLFIALCEP